jgi:hypothetical protein
VAVLTTACGAALAVPDDGPPAPEPSVIDAPPPLAPLPEGRAVGRTSPDLCLDLLVAHEVGFEPVDPEAAPGIEAPVRLVGPIGGVSLGSSSRTWNNEVYDCRLVLALLAWSSELAEAGVVRIDHASSYRPGARVSASGAPSGHAAGLALDVMRFHRADGSVLDVLDLWSSAERGADPCGDGHDDPGDLAALRALVCGAAEADLFQIVLTPHFNETHRNHVHLEVRPDVEWSYVH